MRTGAPGDAQKVAAGMVPMFPTLNDGRKGSVQLLGVLARVFSEGVPEMRPATSGWDVILDPSTKQRI